MMKDKQDPFSGMSLEELWQLFPVFLTEHRPVWAQWYQEEGKRLLDILSMEDICEISHVHPIHLGQAHSGYPGGNKGRR